MEDRNAEDYGRHHCQSDAVVFHTFQSLHHAASNVYKYITIKINMATSHTSRLHRK